MVVMNDKDEVGGVIMIKMAVMVRQMMVMMIIYCCLNLTPFIGTPTKNLVPPKLSANERELILTDNIYCH